MKRDVAALIFMKTKPRNKMGDSLLDDCLQFIERDIFFQVDKDGIVNTFLNFRKLRPYKNDKKK